MWILALLISCSAPVVAEAPVVPEAPVAAAALDAVAVARAKGATRALGATLKGELVRKMGSDGPLGAMEVCASSAQSLTAGVGRDLAVDVGRSSLRLRNEANAGPSWVKAWLEAQGERAAEGVSGELTAATDAQGRAVVRWVGPIPVEAPCLVCHGASEARSPELQAALAAAYPSDRASGYGLGELRGAIWAEARVIETGLVLPLDGDAKWALDQSTRDAMVALRAAVAKAPETVAGAQAAGAAADAAVAAMIAGCEMQGPSHDALHSYLGAIFPAIEGLKGAADLEGAGGQRERLLALNEQFDAAFE